MEENMNDTESDSFVVPANNMVTKLFTCNGVTIGCLVEILGMFVPDTTGTIQTIADWDKYIDFWPLFLKKVYVIYKALSGGLNKICGTFKIGEFIDVKFRTVDKFVISAKWQAMNPKFDWVVRFEMQCNATQFICIPSTHNPDVYILKKKKSKAK